MRTLYDKVKSVLSIRMFLHRKSMLRKIVLSYVVIGAILLSLLSTLLYMKFAENSMEQINSISEKSLEQSYNIMSTLWGATYAYMKKEFNTDSGIAMAMYSREFTPLDTGDISSRLDEIVRNNNIIHSVYVYNKKADMVFSNLGPYTDSEHFYDVHIIRDISSIRDTQNKGFIVLYRKMDLTIGTEREHRNMISVVFFDDALENATVFNLDQNLVQKAITSEKPDQASQILVINREGIIIAHPDTAMIFRNVSGEDYFVKANSMIPSAGYYNDRIEGKKTLVTYRKWDMLGWTFISEGDYSRLLRNVRQLQDSVILWTGVFVLLSILIAAFFAGKIYTPMYRLLRSIKGNSPSKDDKDQNEYDYLSNIYNTLIADIGRLREQKNSSRMVLKKELLYGVIHGEWVRRDELHKNIQELGLRMEGDKFQVAVLRLDNTRELLESHSPEDMALYRFAIGNIADELFSESFKVETVDSGEDNVSVIISVEEETDGLSGNIMEMLENIRKAVADYLHFSLTAALGSVEEGIKGIHRSYGNAMDSSNYRLVYGKSSVIDYQNAVLSRRKDYEYPLELEKSLVDSLKAGEASRVRNALESFISYIGQYSYEEIMLALTQLNLISYRTVKGMLDADELENSGIIMDYRQLNKLVSGYDTLDEINGFLAEFFSKVVDAQKKKRENKYEDIIHKIVKHVEENFHDPCISVEGLAELVELSPNYVRTLFKENMGKSISNHINDVRFNKAREFLVNTDYPANRIAEMIGFPGGSYFYTAFKKAAGVSPDEYRKLNREK